MKKKKKWDTLIMILLIITIIMYFMLVLKMLKISRGGLIPKEILNSNKSAIEGFALVFISIFLEALPFVMIGSFVSALIHLFVSENFIARIIPNNKFIALICAGLMGIIFPVCECAIVPIMRRLIKKGVPVYIGVTFMVAVPIVNPIVLLSTYYAFSENIPMVFLRGIGGLVCAFAIGYLISILQEKGDVLKNNNIFSQGCSCTHHSHETVHNHSNNEHKCCCCGHTHHEHKDKPGVVRTVIDILEHTSLELMDVGKFLTIGALLSAAMQIYISKEALMSIGQGKLSSILVMMALAFILSLCSEADAFIARTFLPQFTTSSVAVFLILGPMIDLKNTIMLSGAFKTKFVVKLIFVIFSVCFIAANIISFMGI